MRIGKIIKLNGIAYVIIGSIGEVPSLFGFRTKRVAKSDLTFDKILLKVVKIYKGMARTEYSIQDEFVTFDKNVVLNAEFVLEVDFCGTSFENSVRNFINS